IEAIEQKTDYRFVYNVDDIDAERLVTINVKDQLIALVLDRIFLNTDVSYKIRGTQILLKKEAPRVSTTTQQENIRGRILDENGLPLPGASIVEQGTANAVSTDGDGYFEISVSGPDAILVVTFIGYKDKSFPASEFPSEYKMEVSQAELDEVVVVGYGTSSRRDITGAVSSVSAAEMNQGAIATPLQLIGGKMAGVNINQTGS